MPRLKHFVEKSREGTYYTIPFTVPENVSRVTVSYSYWQGTKGLLREIHPQNIIDLGLMDEKRRFLGGRAARIRAYLSAKISPRTAILCKDQSRASGL